MVVRFFVVRNVGDDEAVAANFFGAFAKLFETVGEGDVEIGHEEERDLRLGGEALHELEGVLYRGAAFEGLEIGLGDGGAVGDGVGKWDLDFDERRAGIGHGEGDFFGFLERGVAGHDVGHDGGGCGCVVFHMELELVAPCAISGLRLEIIF